MIKSLSEKKIEIQVVFPSPETVSLNSQSEPDQIEIKISKDMILNDFEGNSLVVDFGESRDNNIEVSIPI